MRRLVSAAAILLLAFSAGWGQSLTEAAKKEKERRAAFKNKPTTIITNDTLLRISKQEAVSTTRPEAASEPAAEVPVPTDNPNPSNTIVPQTSTVQATPLVRQNVDSSSGGVPTNQESRWQKAKEYADLLELKLNALWQEFYSLNDMTPRDKIQQDISDTFEKYTQARQEEAKALADLQKQKGR
jgi:hypothetical protein